MGYTDFKGATNYLGAPPGWNEDANKPPCGTLPVKVSVIGETPVMSSFWKPDAAELKTLNEGGHVRLDIIGGAHPPVYVTAEMVEPIDAPNANG